MEMKRSLRVVALAVLLGAVSLPVSAQITTGTVFGNVKDPQGAVVPGATVTLTSESQGTRLAPVQTNASGDYVFAGVPSDTYTVLVTLDGFKTAAQQGVNVSAGERRVVPPVTLTLGGQSELVTVKAEVPTIQSRERRTVVRRGDDDAREHSAARGTQFRGPRDPRARRGGHDPAGRRRVQQHHDGRRLDHGHGQQRTAAPDERRVHCGSESVDVGVSGGVRPIERPADFGRHQERHEPVPRGRLRHPSQQQVELEHLGQQVERHSHPCVRAVRLGLRHRRTGRQAGREQQAVLLPRAGVSAAEGRRDDPAVPGADPAGAGRGFLTDARQQRRAVQPDSRRVDRPSLHGIEHHRLLPGWRRAGRIPANRLYQPGINILNMWPIQANLAQAPGTNYNFESTDPTVYTDVKQPAIRMDYQLSPKLRITGKYSGTVRQRQRPAGIDSGLQRRAEYRAVDPRTRDDGQLQSEFDDLHRGHLRLEPEPARNPAGHRRVEPEQHRPGRASAPVRERRRPESRVLRVPRSCRR